MTQVLCDAFGGFVWVSWHENITGQGRVWHTVALWVQACCVASCIQISRLPKLVGVCFSAMAPTFSFVASLLVLSEAIRSEDDLHAGAMHHSAGVVEESAALICSLGFKFEFPNYDQLADQEHPCCAAAKTCKQGKATATCTEKCNAKVMGVLDNDIWLPESCVSPASVAPPEEFKESKLNNVPAVSNAAVKAFEGKILTAKNDKLEITC